MRVMTRRIAGLEPGEWDQRAKRGVQGVFDGLAPEWHTRTSPLRTQVVEDALERGVGRFGASGSLALEIGSGIGTYSSLISKYLGPTVSMDLSFRMVALAPRASSRVVADGAQLPIADGAADAVVLINAFFFPDEVERVLQSGGLVVWVNSSGPDTPIHLNTEDLVAAVPFSVDGVDSMAGVGTWCVLRRLEEPSGEQ